MIVFGNWLQFVVTLGFVIILEWLDFVLITVNYSNSELLTFRVFSRLWGLLIVRVLCTGVV